jgi:hypothetical protein
VRKAQLLSLALTLCFLGLNLGSLLHPGGLSDGGFW